MPTRGARAGPPPGVVWVVHGAPPGSPVPGEARILKEPRATGEFAAQRVVI